MSYKTTIELSAGGIHSKKLGILYRSEVNISLNLLVKGAIKAMKDTNKTDTKRDDIAKFKKISIIFVALGITLTLSLVLYYVFENSIHSSVHVALAAITMYFAIRFEKERKKEVEYQNI